MSRLADVNTTDLRDAIALGCKTMCSVFNRDDDNIPFFGSQVLPDPHLSFSWAHSEAHVPGRHLNALLSAEEAIGVEIDEECIENHARAAFLSYGGPVPLPLNRHEIGGPLRHFLAHNVREGFHALYALAHYRQSERARDIAEASIEAILRLWNPTDGWDVAHIEGELGLDVFQSTFIPGLARAIGPLVKLYRDVGVERALELAMVLKEKTVAEFFTPDGAYDRDAMGTHSHSVTCVLSSLAQLAEVTGDGALLERVRTFYDNGLRDLRDEIGWSPESTADGADPDRGEGNNTGDIVETALILARHVGPEYYEDAERILRCHLLPSQLRDTSFIPDLPNPGGEDGRRDIARRHVGAFGFPAPYGHRPVGAESIGFNMDIVGGAVGSLCEAHRDCVRADGDVTYVNLLFDRDHPAACVESPYTHGALCVPAKRSGPLLVRMPSWLDSRNILVKGTNETPRVENGYLVFAEASADDRIELEFELPERDVVLRHRTREIPVRLRGDEVVAMGNFGADLTYFPPLDDA